VSADRYLTTSLTTVVVTSYWLIVYVEGLISHGDECAMYVKWNGETEWRR